MTKGAGDASKGVPFCMKVREPRQCQPLTPGPVKEKAILQKFGHLTSCTEWRGFPVPLPICTMERIGCCLIYVVHYVYNLRGIIICGIARRLRARAVTP